MTQPGLFSEPDATTAMGRTAVIDGAYRYYLARWWGEGPRAVWIMCNPSTADAAVDDRTVGRVRQFSRDAGMSGAVIVNAYAYRTPKPSALRQAAALGVDIVGPQNDAWIRTVIGFECGMMGPVVAWGANVTATRAAAVADVIRGATTLPPLCLGTTASGAPRHPLYVPAATPLTPWRTPE